MRTDRPTATTVQDLLDGWTSYRAQILAGNTPSYVHAGWTSVGPMPRTVETVTALVMSPDRRRNAPLLRTLLDGLGPRHWPLVGAAHVWLQHRALDAWIAASTLTSADRVALLKVFLDTGSPANGDRTVVGETPLHQAVLLQDPALVRTLIDAGANAQERWPVPPLDANGHPSLMVTRPEQFPHKRLPGETLLHLAAVLNDAPMCQVLLDRGVPLGVAPRPDGSPGRSPAQAARDNDAHAALAVLEAVVLRAGVERSGDDSSPAAFVPRPPRRL